MARELRAETRGSGQGGIAGACLEGSRPFHVKRKCSKPKLNCYLECPVQVSLRPMRRLRRLVDLGERTFGLSSNPGLRVPKKCLDPLPRLLSLEIAQGDDGLPAYFIVIK